jgi:hypothetical protein
MIPWSTQTGMGYCYNSRRNHSREKKKKEKMIRKKGSISGYNHYRQQ